MERTASEVAMFSFWTRICGGTSRCVGAKFQMALMPLRISRSHTPCAAAAGTVRIPMRIFRRLHRSSSAESGRTGLPLASVPATEASESKAATIFRPYSEKPL